MRYRYAASLVLCLSCLSVAAEAVDTLQFERIQHGMSEAEVRQHLGAPGKVYVDPSTAATEPKSRAQDIEQKRRHMYFYPGKAQMMDTLITFEDGKVVDKTQVAR